MSPGEAIPPGLTQPISPMSSFGAPNVSSPGIANPSISFNPQGLQAFSAAQPGGGGQPPPDPNAVPQAQQQTQQQASSGLQGVKDALSGAATAKGLFSSLGISDEALQEAARVAVGGEIAASPFQGVGPQPPRAGDIPDLATLPGVQAFGQDIRSRLTDLTGRTQKLQDLQLPADIQSSVDREFQRFEDDVTKQFKLFRPGADLATDTGYRDAILNVRQVRAEANAKARLEFVGVARNNLLAELQVNQQMLPYLGELASLDIQTLAARTGLSLQEANQFREIMGLLGVAVATGGRSPLSGFGQTQTQTPANTGAGLFGL